MLTIMYKALYYLSKGIQFLALLFVFVAIKGIVGRAITDGLSTFFAALSDIDELVALFAVFIIPAIILFVLNYWIDPKLKARF
jgi:ABC-type sulfate transport system permease subunit